MLDDRKLEVLRAIVEDFVSTNEPVGSKALAERHHLGVSPATVRNDMAALEDEGYITHPHTSAGRIPTDRGYRLFVDRLSTVKPLSSPERRAIQTFLEGAADLDDVVRRTVRLLSQLTQQVAVVQYPSLSRSAVRHLEIVHLAPNRLLLVLITDTGRVEQRVVELPGVLAEDDVAHLRTRVRQPPARRPAGRRAGRAGRPARRRAVRHPPGAHQRHGRRAGDPGGEARGARRDRRHREPHPVRARLPAHAASRPRVARGAGRPAQAHRRGQRPHHRARQDRRGEQRGGTPVHVRGHGRLRPRRAPYAGLGVVGPTRMDYPQAIGQVRAVARYVGDLLAGA